MKALLLLSALFGTVHAHTIAILAHTSPCSPQNAHLEDAKKFLSTYDLAVPDHTPLDLRLIGNSLTCSQLNCNAPKCTCSAVEVPPHLDECTTVPTKEALKSLPGSDLAFLPKDPTNGNLDSLTRLGDAFHGALVIPRFSVVLLKLKMADLLPDVDEVLVTDVDVAPIVDLYDVAKEFHSAVDAARLAGLPAPVMAALHDHVGVYNSIPHVPRPLAGGLLAGLLYMNLTAMRAAEIQTRVSHVTKALVELGPLILPEQDIITAFAARSPHLVVRLGCEWAYLPGNCPSVKILHGVGNRGRMVQARTSDCVASVGPGPSLALEECVRTMTARWASTLQATGYGSGYGYVPVPAGSPPVVQATANAVAALGPNPPIASVINILNNIPANTSSADFVSSINVALGTAYPGNSSTNAMTAAQGDEFFAALPSTLTSNGRTNTFTTTQINSIFNWLTRSSRGQTAAVVGNQGQCLACVGLAAIPGGVRRFIKTCLTNACAGLRQATALPAIVCSGTAQQQRDCWKQAACAGQLKGVTNCPVQNVTTRCPDCDKSKKGLLGLLGLLGIIPLVLSSLLCSLLLLCIRRKKTAGAVQFATYDAGVQNVCVPDAPVLQSVCAPAFGPGYPATCL